MKHEQTGAVRYFQDAAFKPVKQVALRIWIYVCERFATF